ncbi:PucR family transcriptional regulator [Anaeromicrobium sediminis]|uniref:GGDEF domain-containing protein n=1 Tax=Anaeromicrobium sediminis TaxID=1478221 RepID=A0A267MD63_9FIRM|nr:PucR family transcriptional regulator [Anaeromicrobium sediminis]PAB57397.1 hypothetical protein CCE28_19065 [Anaeromicrobium sediminis]
MKNNFGITIEELLKLNILKDAKVISGQMGLNRRVTKINVMEVPDIIDWVGEGEFILTTAYSVKDNMKELKNLITKFNKKGLAGIGIKTKRYIKEIPKSIINISEQLSFPIVEIPQNISYPDIMTPALTEIINHQSNALGKIEEINNKIMNLMIEGGTLKEIGQVLHENIHNTMAIKENIFRNVICFGNCGEFKDTLEKVDYGKEKMKVLNEEGITLYYENFNIKSKMVSRIRIPIYAKGVNYGDLFIWEDYKKLNSLDFSIIKSCTPLIALDLMKKLSVFEIESKHKIEFFDDLLSNDEFSHRKALNKGYVFGFDEKLSYATIVIDLNEKIKMRITPNNVDFLKHLNNKVLGIVERLRKSVKDTILYGDKSDKIIILFGCKENDYSKKKLLNFCEEIVAHGKLEDLHKNFSIGIGRFYENSRELYKSYREALKSSKKAINKTIVHYDDLGIYRILSYEELKGELSEFYKEMLEPLVTYDKEKNSQLVDTLEEYFKCKGNLKRMSENMYTHYNTVIYRMQRIKEITDVDFEDYNNILNMQIALKVYEMNREI